MDELVFSVIVTAYNQPECIKKAVESVLNQTVKCFELIVVDDCSTDETPQVLKALSENHPEMKIIRHQKNGSSHAARCTGVENASGQYVIFLDGDDYLFPNALERLLNEVVKGTETFDVCEYSYVCQPTGELIPPGKWDSSKPRIDYYLDHDSPVTVWNKLYKTSVVKEAFQHMQSAYIRCGDDTYETICIAYFTKAFIQREIEVVNYQLDIGVSKRKNSFESNLRHCESFKVAMNCLNQFLQESSYSKKEEMYSIVEQKFFDWISCVMKNNTEESDIVKSLLLLPRYFRLEIIEPDFKQLYSRFLKIKKIKKVIKKLLFWFKK